MSEAERLRQRMERRSEAQLAKARAALHEKLERIRRKREKWQRPGLAPF